MVKPLIFIRWGILGWNGRQLGMGVRSPALRALDLGGQLGHLSSFSLLLRHCDARDEVDKSFSISLGWDRRDLRA